MTTSVSLFAVLEEHARRVPETDAIVGGDRRIGYRELVKRVAALAEWLDGNGVAAGEATGVSLAGETDHLLTAMALLCLGAPQVNLPSHEPDAARAAIVDRIGVCRVVAEGYKSWMDDRTVVSPPFSTLARRMGDTPSSGFAWPPDAIAVYGNTSGSTGATKTFGLTPDRLLAAAKRHREDPRERRVLRTSSMEYDSSRLHRIVALLAGNTCVFDGRLEGVGLADLCARAEVTAVHIGTYKLASLMRSSDTTAGRLPRETCIVTGGSRVPGPLRAAVRRSLTDNLWVTYATSEVGPISFATPDQHEAFPEGVGYPLAGVGVEIVDETGAPVAPGDVGLARIRRAAAPGGYLDGAGSSAAFGEGWFQPGDLLSQRPGEPLIFHGRIDDMMILNGINVFPGPIEDWLESQPAIAEAVAYPVRSRLHGDIPVAAVVLREDAGGFETDAVLDSCRRALGSRAPRRISVVGSIPRNAAGKPQRRLLAQA